MPVKELPVIITPTIAADPDKLAKSVMRNFDHLIGEAGYMYDQVGSIGRSAIGAAQEVMSGALLDEDLKRRLDEQGVGTADGAAPGAAPNTVTLVSGINYDVWVIWSTVKNNSPLSFVVERATAAAGPWTKAGETVQVPGTETDGRWQYHDTGLALNTNYYYRVAARDDDGLGPFTAAYGPVQVNKTVTEQLADLAITSTKISDSAITTPKLAANSVLAGKIAAGQIVTEHMVANSINGDRITGNTIHGDKVIANTVVAKDIFGKTITGYTINGAVITGGTLQTATAGNRIVLDAVNYADRIRFLSGTTVTGELFAGYGTDGMGVIGYGNSGLILGGTVIESRVAHKFTNWATFNSRVVINELINFAGNTTATAGATEGYIVVHVAGIAKKIPYRAFS